MVRPSLTAEASMPATLSGRRKAHPSQTTSRQRPCFRGQFGTATRHSSLCFEPQAWNERKSKGQKSIKIEDKIQQVSC